MTAFCQTLPVSGAVAVAAGLLLSGCMKNLPTAPSVPVLTSGVAIYEHADFAGDSALVTADLGDLKDFSGRPANERAGPTSCRRSTQLERLHVVAKNRARLARHHLP